MHDLRSVLNVRRILAGFLQEDIGSGDITSDSIIPEDLKARAQIFCKARSAVVCGLEEAAVVFDICGCRCKQLAQDGSKVHKGKAVLAIEGKARDILKAERTALNIIMRMSGIATETHYLTKKARGVKVLATRKTAPGLRYFDKKAVVMGGGGAHRMRLDDMVLIKDNHLALAGSPKDCVKNVATLVGSSVKVECEARNMSEAIEAASAGADIVMLDNFTPTAAAKTIKTLSRMGLRKKCKIEISGGVNERNIGLYASSRPDFISLGYITHSPKAIDFSLDLKAA